jgi:selenide,water dikinase
MAEASGVTIAIDSHALPVLPGAADLAAANLSGGAKTNHDHFAPRVKLASSMPASLRLLAFDPQTSGGLLLAVRPASIAALLAALAGTDGSARQIGRVSARAADGTLVEMA